MKRLSEIDSVRAIAILSVIMIHVSAAYAGDSKIAFYLNQLARYAVPVFILLSGFSLFHVDLNRPQDSWIVFYGKRLKKIFVPYVIWTILYTLYTSLVSGKPINISYMPLTLLHGLACYHLYFIIIIMQLYLIYPLLRILMRKHAALVLVITFIVTLYYQTYNYLLTFKVKLPVLHILFGNYMVLFTWVFYFAAGMYLALKPEILKSLVNKRATSIIVWIISFGILILDSKTTGTFDSSIRPSVMLFSMTSFILIYRICDFIRNSLPKIERMLGWVSDNSFFIYFSHAMVLSALLLFIKTRPIGLVLYGGPGMLLLFIVTCAASFIIAWIASFLPFNSLLGSRGKRNKPLSN